MTRTLIILGGPLTPDAKPGHHLIERLKYAAEIHRRFDRIIVTGTNTQKLAYTEARVMEEWLLERGISCECDHFARTTIENALFTRDFVSDQDIVSVLTNSFHVARVALIFTRFWGPNFHLEFISAPTVVQDQVTQNESHHLVNFLTKISPLSDEKFSFIKPPKLHQAVISGNIELVSTLMEKGVDVWEKYESPLYNGKLDAFDLVSKVNLDPVQVTVISLLLMKKCSGGVCFIRHAESIHNLLTRQGKVVGEPDTHLSEFGVSISKEIGQYVARYNLLDDFVVYTSPLTRALETCKNIVPKSIQVTVTALLTEKVTHVTDTGTPLSILVEKYPEYSFDFDQEKWWYSDTDVEPEDLLKKRVQDFARKIDLTKKNVAITHGGFIRKARGDVINNCEARLSLIKK